MPSSLEIRDQMAQAADHTGHRVSLESIEKKVRQVEYYRPAMADHMTIALVKMWNGFIVVGKSAPADPKNYNAELGQHAAYEDALQQVWALEGYLLKQYLYETSRIEVDPDNP
jgi:hypothetical protein